MKSSNFRKKAILYGILAILCLINVTTLWIFLIIFAGLSALYFWLANKHKNDKNNAIEQAIQDAKEKKKNKKKKLDLFSIEEHRIRKAMLNKQLAAIEADFSDDIFDEDDDSDEDDEDNEDDEDDE